MHFLFLAAQFEFMTRFSTMILYFTMCTFFTTGLSIKWDISALCKAPPDGTHMDSTPTLQLQVHDSNDRTGPCT